METKIGTIGNYYGNLLVKKQGEKYFWGIEDYDGIIWEEIPKEVYNTLITFEAQRVNEQKSNTVTYRGFA